MGFTLGIATKPEKSCPFWFSKTDSKALFDYLVFRHVCKVGEPDVIGMIEKKTKLDFAPLRKVGSDSCEREEFESEADWKKQKKINDGAWQTPATLSAFLRLLLKELARQPKLLSSLKMPKDEAAYFKKGFFVADLEDLARMADWAKKQGVRRMSIIGG